MDMTKSGIRAASIYGGIKSQLKLAVVLCAYMHTGKQA